MAEADRSLGGSTPNKYAETLQSAYPLRRDFRWVIPDCRQDRGTLVHSPGRCGVA